MKNIRIGELLVESGIINETQLKSALAVQKESGGKRLGDILIDLGVISEEQLMEALKKRLNVPLAGLANISIPSEVLKEVPEAYARQYNTIPIRLQGNMLEVATADPLDYGMINQLSLINGRRVETALAPRAEIAAAIAKFYSKRQVDEIAEDVTREREISAALEQLAEEDLTEMEGRVGSAPIVRFVNTIIEQAFFKRASDIHLEPYEQNVRVRFRVDGDLIDITELSPAAHASLVTRIKIMAGMDIAERRLPLDGRFDVAFEDIEISMRVSSMPTVFGEKIVMRLLTDNKTGVMKVDELGMTDYNMELFYKLIGIPNGIVLVTGPTGSGKTTTLYSILAEIATPLVNVATIEDPVEKIVAGVSQTQINPKAGLTFASGLRSLMRQDPDIIMIGEIRDGETAEIASRAAITGHLVLSSLHTNNAAAAYMRLVDMGIEPYIVASSVVGIVAQRLVKYICPKCKEEYIPTQADKAYLHSLGIASTPRLYYGAGCDFCNMTGHFGRTAIHEIVRTDNEIREMVVNRAKTQDILAHLEKKGQRFLMYNALQLLEQGKIDIYELYKIAGNLED
ncbi:GspE/PulE family protein [Christensenellaceae bacterium OttesenSCG-928-K19]|nr:GspE/PulE family protein [Christensenellaceae bacterium OttesenSCG-928-K19]